MEKIYFLITVLSFMFFLLNFRKVFVMNYRNKRVILFGLPLTLTISTMIFYFGTVDYKRIAFYSIVVSLIGFVDDIYGTSDKGLKGHLKALLKGRITTGLLKLVVISGISFYMALEETRRFFNLITGFILIASLSNLFNLLDLRPGRAIKSSIPFFVFLILLSGKSFYLLSLILLFYLIYLYFDLKEFVMLGDAGSNSLGFLIGNFFLVVVKIFWVQLFVAAIAVLLNLLSEKVSFSEVIKKNRILKFLDELGRTPNRL